ncbi:MAG: DHH family phosphoesterase, partial [Treponema sp.]|nr:DHH family phosphoesterase [Treponema sp.]
MKEITRDEAAALETFIVSHDFFFIAGHKEPDGDAICSCLGVAALLEHFDRPYQLLSAGPFKRTELTPYAPLFTADVQFLSNEDRKHTGLIIVDCSELQRLGELNGDVSGIDTYVIDHHRTAACPAGARCYIDDSAPSTANLIQQ